MTPRIQENRNNFTYGMVLGILIGFTVSILGGTLAFHMHLEQMDQVRAEFHKHAQEAREIHSK